MDERAERIERGFEVPIVVAALLVIPILFVEQSRPGEAWETLAAVGNWLVWLLFLAEVVVMLAVVPDRGQWLRAHPLEVAIVVLTPPFLPPSLQALRVFRLLRLLRLIVAVRYARRLFSLDGLRYAAVLAVLTALGGGAAFAAAEGRDVSTWDGVWWAVTTMTTGRARRAAEVLLMTRPANLYFAGRRATGDAERVQRAPASRWERREALLARLALSSPTRRQAGGR